MGNYITGGQISNPIVEENQINSSIQSVSDDNTPNDNSHGESKPQPDMGVSMMFSRIIHPSNASAENHIVADKLPVELPVELPMNIPVELPVELPTTLVELPVELPMEIPVEIPVELPVELPVSLAVKAPVIRSKSWKRRQRRKHANKEKMYRGEKIPSTEENFN